MISIDCISDLHMTFPQDLPGGDILVIAGDITYMGTIQEIHKFNEWVTQQPYEARVLVAGNHDWLFERVPELAQGLITGVTHYLNDSGADILGLKFWGSPVQPEFCNWAFNRQRGAQIKRHWDLIPEGLDVLVTHGPPLGILDETHGEHVGCADLLATVIEKKPKMHVFGHIHEGHGVQILNGTKFVNAAIMDGNYHPVNKHIRVER